MNYRNYLANILLSLSLVVSGKQNDLEQDQLTWHVDSLALLSKVCANHYRDHLEDLSWCTGKVADQMELTMKILLDQIKRVIDRDKLFDIRHRLERTMCCAIYNSKECVNILKVKCSQDDLLLIKNSISKLLINGVDDRIKDKTQLRCHLFHQDDCLAT